MTNIMNFIKYIGRTRKIFGSVTDVKPTSNTLKNLTNLTLITKFIKHHDTAIHESIFKTLKVELKPIRLNKCYRLFIV